MAPKPQLPAGVYPSGKTHFQYRITLPADPDGKRRQEVRGGFETADDAALARARRRQELGMGVGLTLGTTTVAEAMDEYLSGHAIRLKPNTRQGYRRRVRLYVDPHIGHIKLRDLSPTHLRRWLANLSREIAPSTIRGVFGIVSATLGQAQRDGVIARNVAALVTLPRVTRKKHTILTGDEILRFLDAADRDPYAAMWRLALMVQLRPGELAALRWSDLDLDRGKLTIGRTRTKDDNDREVIGDSAKTPTSHATIDIPASCIDALRRHRVQQAQDRLRYPGRWADLDLVFPALDGRLMHSGTMLGRLRRLCETAGVPRLTPHQLRHTGATWMIEEGEDIKRVQQRLRHASVATTLDLYVHLSDDAQRGVSDRLDADLERQRKGGAQSA